MRRRLFGLYLGPGSAACLVECCSSLIKAGREEQEKQRAEDLPCNSAVRRTGVLKKSGRLLTCRMRPLSHSVAWRRAATTEKKICRVSCSQPRRGMETSEAQEGERNFCVSIQKKNSARFGAHGRWVHMRGFWKLFGIKEILAVERSSLLPS